MSEVLGAKLISYKEVIEFLKTKGRGKNFFDTLRSRHKLIHKPITRPPSDFHIKGMDIKIRRGRSIFYLREIIPYLGEIIRLKDIEGLTFSEIEEKMQLEKKRLEKLRNLELTDDRRLKSSEMIDLFKVASIKLTQYNGWADSSKEKIFLEYVSKERGACGRRYFELTEQLRAEAKKDKDDMSQKVSEREEVGRKLDFYHHIMGTVVEQFKELIRTENIKILAEEWKDLLESTKG